MQLKLGKTAARKNSITFKLSTYLTAKLPKIPASGGHGNLVAAYQMLGNDQYGDCVWAGAGHETMLWNAEANTPVTISEDNVLAAYTAVTGFNPSDPSTDQGTDMQLAASYRQKTGITDANGKVHKVGAYLALANEREIKTAIYLFGACGIGIKFPDSAMTQFNASKPWTVVQASHIEGGHYVPGVLYDSKFLYVVTWGKVQKVAWPFVQKYMDEAIVYLSEEMLINGKSLEGFDFVQLQADLAAIK